MRKCPKCKELRATIVTGQGRGDGKRYLHLTCTLCGYSCRKFESDKTSVRAWNKDYNDDMWHCPNCKRDRAG